jgi:hypothetical protein
MKLVLSLFALLTVQIEVFRITPTGPDLDNLYERLAESAYVVKGRVLDSKGIGARPSPISKETEEEHKKSGVPVLMTLRPGGTLFTVEPEQTVCRQSDLAFSVPEVAPLASPVYVFVPQGEPLAPSKFTRNRGNVPEYLAKGQEYLLFLRKDPRQAQLETGYQLEGGRTYYRTVEGDRGAILLPSVSLPEKPYSFVTPLASAVATFCDAVKAPDVENKIRNLNAVRDHSTERGWRQSVDAAIKALKQAQAKPPE